MKEILWTIVEVVVAIVTILMAIVVLALFGMNLATLPYLAFMVLVLYQIVPRKWGMFGTCSAIIVACIYLANMFLFAMFWQPAFCLMSILMPITAVIKATWHDIHGALGFPQDWQDEPLWQVPNFKAFFLVSWLLFLFLCPLFEIMWLLLRGKRRLFSLVHPQIAGKAFKH